MHDISLQTPLRHWLKTATSQERADLLEKARISEAYLYRIAGGQMAGAELAGRLETALKKLRQGNQHRLPRIDRTSMCIACAGCPYAQKCLKK